MSFPSLLPISAQASHRKKFIEASQAEEMQAVEAEVAATTEEQDLAVVS